MNDDADHDIFSEWSSLDWVWTSAFSLIFVTSFVGNVMVGSNPVVIIQYFNLNNHVADFSKCVSEHLKLS